MFKLYRQHFSTLPVEVAGNSPQPAPRWAIGADQPKVNAGSPTYPLDIAAALTDDHKFLTVAVVNATESTHKITLNIEGVKVGSNSRMWQMTGATLEAVDRLGKKPEIEIKETPVSEVPKTLSVDPISINIYALEVV